MTCQWTVRPRMGATSRIQREVSQAHGQIGSNQKSTSIRSISPCIVSVGCGGGFAFARWRKIGPPTHAKLGYSADPGGPRLPQTTPIDSAAPTRGGADPADIPLPVGSTEDKTMTYSISMNSGRAEPSHTATDLNHPSGDAGCAARLPRQPIAPNDHAAVMPDLAFDAEHQGDPPVAEADRPVALVIEDDPATCRQITAVLMRAGWSVLPARDGGQ